MLVGLRVEGLRVEGVGLVVARVGDDGLRWKD